MKKSAYLAIATLAALGLGVLIQGKPSVADPATITLRTSVYDTEGFERATYFETTSFRRDGSRATGEVRRFQHMSVTSGSGKPEVTFEPVEGSLVHRTVVSAAEGTRTQLFPQSQSKLTYRVGPGTLEHLAGAHPDCRLKFKGFTHEPHAPIQGLEVEKYTIRLDEDCPECGGAKDHEYLAAPSLGCYVVQATVKHADSSRVIQKKELLKVEAGVKEELFVIPDEYAESKPSVILSELSAKQGAAVSPEQFFRFDQAYEANRAGWQD